MSLILNARAKINLTLRVTGKRPDGLHNIKSVMQSVSLRDVIELTRTESGDITLSCDNSEIPRDEENIAFKAAEAFFAAVGEKNKGLDIRIEKNIPIQAGLGGGSADGAAVLRGLNTLYENVFTKEKLCTIGVKIGADVPFCVQGGTCLCEGSGEELTPLPPLPYCKIVIAKGKNGVSTKEAYAALDRSPPTDKYDFDVGVFSRGIEEIASACSNIFEEVTELDDVWELKRLMTEYGALCSAMSGSGSAVYGIFTDSAKAEKTRAELHQHGFWACICKPINTRK